MDRNGTYLGGWPGRTVRRHQTQGKDRTLLASPDTYLFFFFFRENMHTDVAGSTLDAPGCRGIKQIGGKYGGAAWMYMLGQKTHLQSSQDFETIHQDN